MSFWEKLMRPELHKIKNQQQEDQFVRDKMRVVIIIEKLAEHSDDKSRVANLLMEFYQLMGSILLKVPRHELIKGYDLSCTWSLKYKPDDYVKIRLLEFEYLDEIDRLKKEISKLKLNKI
ncbi:hypothetical protein [Marinagarivorans algicola]|uniref:hypothetical protein n=1 Tax=Marinagarivorans algicola TaxID=1513270 RepID=UPI0006B60210|nr:hypothetical protein [Marinagarivorans algicola]